ncbi:MAG: S-methyl-5-thioribose-1-phosphate isomerase, partial [Planctomycetota bacterium]
MEDSVPTIHWEGDETGYLKVLDQSLLPTRVSLRGIRNVSALIDAINELAVRGAPAIGIAAAYGAVLAAAEQPSASYDCLKRASRELRDSRPTAANLFWAVDRMERLAGTLEGDGLPPEQVPELLLEEARRIHAEDRELCELIGRRGAELIEDGMSILTHCNTGRLATGGIGTALGVITTAKRRGKRVRVFVNETRPLLQGARLTLFELEEAGIPATLLVDSAGAGLMAKGEIQAVLVGADRIARNGDVANKVGTYALAIVARFHGIPFYVAAPTTSIDLELAKGSSIPIEERSPDEILHGFGTDLVPFGAEARNPAFDVTPAKLISALIT